MMAVYVLVDTNESILKKSTEAFDFKNPQIDPKQLAEQLAETMILNNGIGLAAPQVGIPLSVFVVGDPTNKESTIAMFNPKIVDTFGEMVYYDEGCLSYPGLYIKIKRPAGVKIRFTDMYGEVATLKYSGMTARAIQHEYDHLEGILYTKRANRYNLDKARKSYKMMIRRRKKAAKNEQ